MIQTTLPNRRFQFPILANRVPHRRLASLILSVLVILVTSCNKSDQPTQANSKTLPQPKPGQFLDPIQIENQSGPNGAAIIRDLVSRYDSATSYSDQAVLYLTYLLHGQRIQEPQPWATIYQETPRDGQRLAAQLFNAEVRTQRNLLSCYVYDIGSANLDNQQLLIPYQKQLPISQLYRDPIAKHFVGGYSELPLDETDLISMPKLIPAPISLLTSQTRNGWLQNPSRVQRLADETVDDKKCYVVRCESQGVTADVWIDQQSQLLVQMSLPLTLLAREITSSPEQVTDVVLLAKFHDAQLNSAVNEDAFRIASHSDATPVRKFVQLPESLPSELIGETVKDFTLIDLKGEKRERLYFDGKVTAFMWLAGKTSYPAMVKFNELASGFSKDKFQLAALYSNGQLAPSNSQPTPEPTLARIIKQNNCTAFYDPQLQTSVALGVKAIPSIVVMDGDSRIQFARTLDKNWQRDVKAAIERVAEGEDVASEMKNEYVRYLDSYHQQLATVSAADLIGRIRPGVAQVSTTKNVSGIRIQPEKIWVNNKFKKAGNLIPLSNPEPTGTPQAVYAVFDGWRTVVELDGNGKTIRRAELKLPVNEAANLIRTGQTADGEKFFAVYATLGERVYLFNNNWQPMAMYPTSEDEHEGVRDCQLTDLDNDGVSELVVAFDKESGVHLVDPKTGRGQQVSKVHAHSLVSLGNEVVVAGEGKIGALKAGLTNVDETELEFRRVASAGSEQLCGLGVTTTGTWNAVGFDAELRRVWTLSVGSQFFETQLEPIAVTQFGKPNSKESNAQTLWAIADTDNVVHLVSGSGKWLGDFQSQSQLHGLTLDSRDGNTFLTLSNETGVECWNLNLETPSSPMRPVSSKR